MAEEIRSPSAKKVCQMATPPTHLPKILNLKKAVRCGNLPEDFWERMFIRHIEKLRMRLNIKAEEAHCITQVMHYKEERKALVEFSSEEIAQLFCRKVAETEFFKQLVTVEMAVYSEYTVTEDNITNANITNDTLRFQDIQAASTPCDKVTDMLGEMSPYATENTNNNKSISVRRRLVATADGGNEIEDGIGRLAEEPLLSEPLNNDEAWTSNPLKMLEPDSTVGGVGILAEELPIESVLHSKLVKVINIPQKFFKDHFIDFLETSLASVLGVQSSENLIVHCTDRDHDGSVTVELETCEKAATLCQLEGLDYGMGVKLSFELISSDQITPSEPILQSKFVTVTNIPQKFFKDHFIDFLETSLASVLGVQSSENLIVHCTDRDHDGSVTVELETCEKAATLCQLEGLDYGMGVKLSFELKPAKEIKSKPKAAQSCSSSGLGSHALSMDEDEDDVLPLAPSGAIHNFDDDESSKKYTLDDPEVEDLWFDALLRTKHLFTGHNHSSAFARVVMALDKVNVETTVSLVERKRKNLLGKYRRALKAGTVDSWDRGAICTAIFGKGNAVNEDGPCINMADPVQVAAQAAKFTKGAVWTHAATVLLISTCKENWKVMKDTTKNKDFYGKVSKILVSERHHYSAQQCQDHILGLQKKYRDLEGVRMKTGAASIENIPEIRNWPYLNLMRDLMQNDVSAHPTATMAVGSTSRLASSQQEVVKPKSVSERKAQAIERLAEALAAKNDILKQLVSKK